MSRRKGLIALETEIDRAVDPFLKIALALAVDGTNAKVARQILEVESDARREYAEAPADVLETAAGYTPTLGILGAVLGLIHVMQSLERSVEARERHRRGVRRDGLRRGDREPRAAAARDQAARRRAPLGADPRTRSSKA